MASFSLSKSSLNLTPPSITGGPRSNYATAGDANPKAGPGGIKFYPDLYTNAGRNTGFNIVQDLKDNRIGLAAFFFNILDCSEDKRVDLSEWFAYIGAYFSP